MSVKNSEMLWTTDNNRLKEIFIHVNAYKLATVYSEPCRFVICDILLLPYFSF